MRFIVTFPLLITALAWAQAPIEKKAEVKLSAEERAILALVNAERKKVNLPALTINDRLLKAARDHSLNMAKQQKMDHVLDEKKLTDRVAAVGYRYRAIGENVAYGAETPDAVMQGWMQSKGHRENILDDKFRFTEIGIGVTKDTEGRLYWTQVFGRQGH